MTWKARLIALVRWFVTIATALSALGFVYTAYTAKATPHEVHPPWWLALLIFGVPTFLMWRTHNRVREWRMRGLCTSCGYPRRGIPLAAPCPECGTIPT